MTRRVLPGETLLEARNALVARIQRSAPPVRTFDGRLQRWRDALDRDDVELETVWNGGEGLTTMGERRGR